jgi:hypothetical protein
MKKLLILFMMILSFSSYSQELTGCMGINFGDPKHRVKEVKNQKGGFVAYKDNPGALLYTNGSFAGHDAVGAVFRFYDNRMHTAVILLVVDQKPMVMSFYRNILSELTEKYGVTPEKIHTFKRPYYEGDGYEHNAISLGYAELFAVFRFNNDNAISVEVTKDLSLKITYQNHELASKEIDQNKQKNSNDY